MNIPSSFCTICTNNSASELLILLKTLTLHHSNSKMLLMCDTNTQFIVKNEIKNTTDINIDITYFVELNEWAKLNRDEMTGKNLFGKFLQNKMEIMKKGINKFGDTLFLDCDIIILNKITNIDHSKNFGLSPHYVCDTTARRVGYYNAGFAWSNSIDACNYWISIIDHKRKCPEQVNMHMICDKFKYFEFDESYNVQPSRFTAGPERQRFMIAFLNIKNNRLFYKENEIKCIHTHFRAPCLKVINDILYNNLKKCNTYEQELLCIDNHIFHHK